MAPRKSSEHVISLGHLQLAIAAAGVALWTWNVDTDHLTMDDSSVACEHIDDEQIQRTWHSNI